MSTSTASSTSTVGQRFTQFLENLQLTSTQVDDGATKHSGVRSCLNQHYYGWSSGTANSLLVGSWGKHTRIRPPRDIDVLFKLSKEVYDRFQQRLGNKQAQLLQEVKGVLEGTYTRTTIRGDRNVVVVPFDTFAVEVIPAFELVGGQFSIPDSNNGGKYKTADYNAETTAVSASDQNSSGNTRHLIRMMKCWQGFCSVPLRSFCLELVAVEFIAQWANRGKSSVYYDWMVRDFLAFLKGKRNTYVFAPGTFEIIWLGDDWYSRADTAHGRAEKACQHEAESMPYSASSEWQKIFGTDFPSP